MFFLALEQFNFCAILLLLEPFCFGSGRRPRPNEVRAARTKRGRFNHWLSAGPSPQFAPIIGTIQADRIEDEMTIGGKPVAERSAVHEVQGNDLHKLRSEVLQFRWV